MRIVIAFLAAGVVGWYATSLLVVSPRAWPYAAALMVLCFGLPLLVTGWPRAATVPRGAPADRGR